MKRLILVSLFLCLCFANLVAQNAPAGAVIKPGENLVTENLPPVPASVAEKATQYGETRSATLYDWHPMRREMLIGTRFADTNQVHMVKMPGGARSQMTFFPDRVTGARYQSKTGNYFVLHKDVGGGEWYQYYRYDLATGDIALLTDGKSRNGSAQFANSGDRFAYTSTRRTGQDNDVWLNNAMDPKVDRLLIQLEGGGWGVSDWSPDDKKILLGQGISANESYIWIADVATGDKKLLTPKGSEQVAYSDGNFSKDGKGIFFTTDKDSEFQRLAYMDLATAKTVFLSSAIKWDVESFELSEDGHTVAFTTNEDGIGKLYLLDTTTKKFRPVTSIPTGVIGGLHFHKNSHDLGFTVSTAKSPSDIYSLNVLTGKVDRWTASETGGLNTASFAEPQLVKWTTFDGKSISGFLYQPDAKKFPGKRPIIVNIHGGPEGQSRPSFLGRSNYYLNELGVAIIYPNVRGSTGYGKTFLKLDNGMHRDDTYKDIGALLDWIKQAPGLDGDKILITGGSYGGHMTWAIATNYNDKICCSLPVVGMSNLVTFLEHTEGYRRDLRRVEYGDEREPKMREYLERTAPMNHSEMIKKPLFAVVGKNDPRVPWTESRQMLDKLKANGTPTWFLMANDEGHGYAKKKNQDFQFYATVMFVRQFLLGDKSLASGQ